MSLLYSIRIESTPPYKVICLDEANEQIDTNTIDTSKLSNLCKNYFRIDTKHDKTSKYQVEDENGAISLAFSDYGTRTKDLKFMLIKKNDFEAIREGRTDLAPPTNDAYDFVTVTHLDINAGQIQMTFREFVKNILEIELPDTIVTQPPVGGAAPIPVLDVCSKSGGDRVDRNFYQYLTLYDIHDMFTAFPDGRSSISFHIDSATSNDSLMNVPNICTQTDNLKFNIHNFIIPGDPHFRNPLNKQFSFLYFGDLMISHFYYDALFLVHIIDSPDFQVFPSDLINSFYSHDGGAAAKTYISTVNLPDPIRLKFEKLCKFSIISLNIFWQTLLSYIHFYLKFSIDDNDASIVIESLRHWVFCGINYNIKSNSHSPSFNGKFVKTITDKRSIEYIAFWFLHKHHRGLSSNHPPQVPPATSGIVYDCTDINGGARPISEFTVSQKDCASLINKIYDKCGLPSSANIAKPRGGDNKNLKGFIKEIYDAFNDPTKTNISNRSNKIIILLAQILKFSGDMSHKTAALIYKNVFKPVQTFDMFTPCVTTIDRPLFASFFMDYVPGIVTGVNAAILELSGLRSKFNFTVDSIRSSGKMLLSYYLPKIDLNLFAFVNTIIMKIHDYVELLNLLYDDTLEFFDLVLYKNMRNYVTNKIINYVYQCLTYTTMFYLSFFSSTKNSDNVILDPAIKNINEPVDVEANIASYNSRYLQKNNRINHAWFAYYHSLHKFDQIYFTQPAGGGGGGGGAGGGGGPPIHNLIDHKFVGYHMLDGADTNKGHFFKKKKDSIIKFSKTPINIAPDTVTELKKVFTMINYPECFEIKENIYSHYPHLAEVAYDNILRAAPGITIAEINAATNAYLATVDNLTAVANNVKIDSIIVMINAAIAGGALALPTTSYEIINIAVNRLIAPGVDAAGLPLNINENIYPAAAAKISVNINHAVPPANYNVADIATAAYALATTKINSVTLGATPHDESIKKSISRQENIKKYVEDLFNNYKIICNNRIHPDICYNSTINIEKTFFLKIDLCSQLGGVDPLGPFHIGNNSPSPYELKNFYRKNSYLTGIKYDDSLLILAKTYTKLKKDVDNNHKYLDLFDNAIGGAGNLSLDDDFDSLFLYTYVYKDKDSSGAKKTTLTPLGDNPATGLRYYYSIFNNISKVTGELFVDIKSVFNVSDVVIVKATVDHRYPVDRFYLFPFLEFSKYVGEKSKKAFQFLTKIKGKFTDNDPETKTNDQLETQIVIDAISNFNTYITDLNRFLDTYKSKFGKCSISSGRYNSMFDGIQCRYIIYFTLLLFNFKCKIKTIEHINSLFHKNKPKLNVSDVLISPRFLDKKRSLKRDNVDRKFYSSNNKFVYIDSDSVVPPAAVLVDIKGIPLPAFDFREDINYGAGLDPRPVNDPSIKARAQIEELYGTEFIANKRGIAPIPPILPPEDIEVIGVFTDVYADSEDAAKFDFTKIKGMYYIQSEEMSTLYSELKIGLIRFFENYKFHFVDTENYYSGIEIL